MAKQFDVIIVGAGPAGLTAAMYAGRSRLKTLVLEKQVPGGRILMTGLVENIPGFPDGITPQEFADRLLRHAQSVEVDIRSEEVTALSAAAKRVTTDSGEYSCRALIIASGAYPKKLMIPGEERLTGRGVSYCAVCDAPFFKDKKVVIIGGGNTVAEEAQYLSRFVAAITIIHRRDDLRATAILQERLRNNPKVGFLFSTVATEITGDARVTGVRIRNVKTGQESAFDCDGVFVYIGYSPETVLLKGQIPMDDAGFIIVDPEMKTSCAGVFACGDCCSKKLYQVVTACADGAAAADAAYRYLAAL
jgi:thioredoxin reductase (NADPH)